MNSGKMGLDLGWQLQVDDRLRRLSSRRKRLERKKEKFLYWSSFLNQHSNAKFFSSPDFPPRYFNSKMAKLRAFLQRLCASLVHWLTFSKLQSRLSLLAQSDFPLIVVRSQKLNEDVEGPVARWRRSTSTIMLELVATSELLPFLTTLDDGLAR